MRSLNVLRILVGGLALLSAAVTASNITWGSIGYYDHLLATQHIQKAGSWFRTQTAKVVYPPKGHVTYATLTAIKAFDWGERKNFGYATLVQGGPGKRNATIYLKSQSGRGLNFTIQYFGR